MTSHVRQPVVVGNWKMNLGAGSGLDAAQQLLAAAADAGRADGPQLVVLPPFTILGLLQQASASTASTLEYGAQDVSPHEDGAFTGDVSATMLADLGCRYVLAGHSERREHHVEDDETVNAKVTTALRHDLLPILCVGEGLDVRRAGEHISHTLGQLDAALVDVSAADAGRMLVAYEPVWAIGTGQVATPDDAQEVCSAIRTQIGELYDDTTAKQVRILYGGSVKSATSAALLAQPDIDGALVGGASLDPSELTAIWRSAQPTPAAGAPA